MKIENIKNQRINALASKRKALELSINNQIKKFEKDNDVTCHILVSEDAKKLIIGMFVDISKLPLKDT